MDSKLKKPSARPMNRIGFDFVGAIAGGGVVGALLDHMLDTTPWCLLGMVLLGFVTAVVNAWRTMQSQTEDNTEDNRE